MLERNPINRRIGRPAALLGAAALLCLLVVQIALAGSPAGASEATASAVSAKKFKKLKKQVKSLQQAVDTLARQPGPQGPQGPRGPAGPTGDPGIRGYLQVDDFSAFDSTTPKVANAFCPAGMTVIGGGATINGGSSIALRDSVPRADGSGWIATAYETAADAANWNVDARAICANVAP